jgi:hypothetical protein
MSDTERGSLKDRALKALLLTISIEDKIAQFKKEIT